MTIMAEGIRIASFPLGQRGGAPNVQPYRADAIYSIDDLTPWLCVGFPRKGNPSPIGGQKVGTLERYQDGPADGLTWWRWLPFAGSIKQIGQRRRYGLYRTDLYQPQRVTLQCYVWPGRFFDPRRYQTMLDEIEQEFGRAIEWERSDLAVRSRVVSRHGKPSDAELLLTIRDELRAVHALERTSALADPEGEAHEELEATASPESRMVAMWAWRRLTDLVRMRRQQAAARVALDIEASDPNQARARRRDERATAARADERETEQLAAQVSRIVDLRRTDISSFELSPAMQRDHRLRRLVRAFAPAMREHWAATPTVQMSTSPPLKAPDVFELWSVARLVRAFTTLGWTVQRRETTRVTATSVGESYAVELTRGDLSLVLEHNPKVHRLDLSAVPPMHVRRISLLEWANANASAPDGLLAAADLTPDYSLRLSSAVTGPLALALGDATLSDPEHVTNTDDGGGGNKSKADKLVTYRERIGWRTGGRLIRCRPACTFIVLPGPSSPWEGTMAGVDSVLLFPDPGVADDIDMATRAGGLLEAMLTTVGADT